MAVLDYKPSSLASESLLCYATLGSCFCFTKWGYTKHHTLQLSFFALPVCTQVCIIHLHVCTALHWGHLVFVWQLSVCHNTAPTPISISFTYTNQIPAQTEFLIGFCNILISVLSLPCSPHLLKWRKTFSPHFCPERHTNQLWTEVNLILNPVSVTSCCIILAICSHFLNLKFPIFKKGNNVTDR